MVIKKGQECFISGLVSRDAEMRSTQTGKILAAFAVAAGKHDDGSTMFVNCKAWQELGAYCKDLQKGDSFAGTGRIETSEYNGKSRTELILNWAHSPMLASSSEAPAIPQPAAKQADSFGPSFTETDDDEDSLPF